MKLLAAALALFGCLYLAVSMGFIDKITGNELSGLSIFSGINTNTVEEMVITHYRQTIPGFAALEANEHYELLTSLVYINDDSNKDVVAILKSDATCGSGGCIASIFLQNDIRGFEPVNFRYTVKSLEPLDTSSNGMHDLRVNNDTTQHLIWSGVEYVLESIN